MSLRAMSSLLIRRFSPRRIPAAQAKTIRSAASGRPTTRSLHTLSNPVGAIGAFSVSGLSAALAGFLYLKKGDKAGEVTHETVVATVTGEVTHDHENVVAAYWREALNGPAILAMFTDKDGNVAWMEYNNHLIFRMHYLTDKELRSEVPMKQVGNVMKVDEAAMKKMIEEEIKKYDEEYKNYRKMVMEQEYKVDEAAMKKRFEDWMKEYGRTYKGKEKARRYEVFKVNAIEADKFNSRGRGGGARYGPTEFSDWTEDELRRLDCRQDEMDGKSYFENFRTRLAEGRFDTHQRKVAIEELDCTDAIEELDCTDAIEELDCTDALKERLRKLAERKAEQERQANKH